MLKIDFRQPGGTPGKQEDWYRKKVRYYFFEGTWTIWTSMGGISVSGSGPNVWAALGDALASYYRWLDWYEHGCTQKAAVRIWGSDSSDRDGKTDPQRSEENDAQCEDHR